MKILSKTIYKILGKRGRITIPWEIRRDLGFAYNDVICFDIDGDSVIVKREKMCNDCKYIQKSTQEDRTAALTELIDEFNVEQLHAALVQLSVKWATMQKCGVNA